MENNLIEIHNCDNILNLNVMSNLKWLIPMAKQEEHVHCIAEFK